VIDSVTSLRKNPIHTFSRSTEADLITDVLDIAAAALGWIEGGLSKESALSVGGFAATAAALSL